MPSQHTLYIQVRADTMHGTPCFVGTRVPVKSLFDYLEAGDSMQEFLDQFPSVSKAQAVHVLEASKTALLATL